MKLLYLTFVDLKKMPTSGSSVRPQKMKQAFEELGIDVITIDGMNNNFSARKNAVAKAKEILISCNPDMCYIEPPAGPMFYYGDVGLIKLLHNKGIPISIFYRDAYWKYPEYAQDKSQSIAEKIKMFIIRRMQIHQWNVFRKYMDIIYFPSLTMAKEFDCPHKDTLPPGAFVPDTVEKKDLSKPLQFIFVGGATKNYGTLLTLEAFKKVNQDRVKAKLFYICPKKQWDNLGIKKDVYNEWLEIVHTSGDENLKPYYEKSDVALLTAPRTFYRDFAVPIKIFEYISYLKPMLVTNCTETERIVKSNHTGWITEDSAEVVADKINELCCHPEEVTHIKENMAQARSNNLWINRAKKVVEDLSRLKTNII